MIPVTAFKSFIINSWLRGPDSPEGLDDHPVGDGRLRARLASCPTKHGFALELTFQARRKMPLSNSSNLGEHWKLKGYPQKGGLKDRLFEPYGGDPTRVFAHK
jgi:hypothetical protein